MFVFQLCTCRQLIRSIHISLLLPYAVLVRYRRDVADIRQPVSRVLSHSNAESQISVSLTPQPHEPPWSSQSHPSMRIGRMTAQYRNRMRGSRRSNAWQAASGLLLRNSSCSIGDGALLGEWGYSGEFSAHSRSLWIDGAARRGFLLEFGTIMEGPWEFRRLVWGILIRVCNI